MAVERWLAVVPYSVEQPTGISCPGGTFTWLLAPAPVVMVSGPLDSVKSRMNEPELVAAFDAIRP